MSNCCPDNTCEQCKIRRDAFERTQITKRLKAQNIRDPEYNRECIHGVPYYDDRGLIEHKCKLCNNRNARRSDYTTVGEWLKARGRTTDKISNESR